MEETKNLSDISLKQQKELIIMANAISQAIFGKSVLSCGRKLQGKIALAVVNLIKDLKVSDSEVIND